MPDPAVPDWQNLDLPDTPADRFDLPSLPGFFRFICHIVGERQKVEVPATLPGLHRIPKYALQEFHNLPNGNYSNALTPGYIRGFDISMLNTVQPVREFLARQLKHLHCVLDVGCAGGKTAAAIRQAGVAEVWGIDPSPYLLKQAAAAHPGIRFVQGTAEQTGFGDTRFDGISACFVFHEIPPRYADMALAEFHRILKPGGLLAIAEPSPIQYNESNWLTLFRNWGFRGIYFRILAGFVFEPFVEAWHKRNIPAWMESHGFELVSDHDACPTRTIIARRKP